MCSCSLGDASLFSNRGRTSPYKMTHLTRFLSTTWWLRLWCLPSKDRSRLTHAATPQTFSSANTFLTVRSGCSFVFSVTTSYNWESIECCKIPWTKEGHHRAHLIQHVCTERPPRSTEKGRNRPENPCRVHKLASSLHVATV